MAGFNVDKIYVQSKTHDDNLALEFKNHKLLFRFGLDAGSAPGQVREVNPVYPLKISFDDDEKMIYRLKNKDISSVENHVLIPDYMTSYKDHKRRIFYEILKREELVKKDSKPTFVTFGGTIVDLLDAPQLFNGAEKFVPNQSWHILAQRGPDGLIYLKSTDGKDTLRKEFMTPKVRRRWDFSIHSRLNFLHMLSYDEDDIDYDRVVMNEYQKSFDIMEEEFGNNRLIVLKEIDAVDSNDNPVKVQMRYRPIEYFQSSQRAISQFFEHKMFFLWCNSRIGNYSKQIIGVIGGEDVAKSKNLYFYPSPRLESLEVIKIDDDESLFEFIREKTGRKSFGLDDKPEPWDKHDSYAFLDRFLTFAAEYVTRSGNDGQVFSFEFQKKWILNKYDDCFITPKRSEIKCLYQV